MRMKFVLEVTGVKGEKERMSKAGGMACRKWNVPVAVAKSTAVCV